MNGKFLLDTNIVIALFAQDEGVQQRLAEAEEIFICSIVLGELYFGARKSARTETNLSHLDEFATSAAVLPTDAITAQYYGRIKHQLRTAGQPIPENDVWISAVAQQHQLTLVSRDAHFRNVADLATEAW
jgi:tRNA(fMet)-specific endonuclease VapC